MIPITEGMHVFFHVSQAIAFKETPWERLLFFAEWMEKVLKPRNRRFTTSCFILYQYCINELKKGSCEELLRTEIDAYCAQSNQYPVMHKRKFVKEGALASSVGGKCLKEDMSRLFDEIFDEKRCALLALPKALSGKE